jgi:hypothetical protein
MLWAIWELAYDALGDYAKAIDYHQQHLAIAKRNQRPPKVRGNLWAIWAMLTMVLWQTMPKRLTTTSSV